MADEEIKSEDKLFSALSYPIPLVALFIIFTDKKSVHFCRYHAWQALFLGLAAMAISLAASILSVIPGIGCLIGIIASLIGLAWFIAAILFAIKTYNGEYVVIPVISDFSKKYIEGQ
jgi:uncharacterized membrane protein